jgi:hypothetical protein
MDLDDGYNPAHRQAMNLQDKFHDYVGQKQMHYDPRATLLQHEIHHLVGEIEARKDPYTIENRIKVIERELRENQLRENPIMHYEHINELQGHYRDLREQIRRIPHQS